MGRRVSEVLLLSIFGSLFRRSSNGTDVSPEAKVARHERIYAVGDIHGRADLLGLLVERIRADIARFDDERAPHIVFLGDYIDRGDHSREVLETLVALKGKFAAAKLTFLRGNHEAAMLSFLDEPSRCSDWLHFGGLQTLASYGVSPPKSTPAPPAELGRIQKSLERALGAHRAFLEKTALFMRSGNVVFCHAGVDPDDPIEEQSEQALLWGCSGFLAKGGIEEIRVVHGHYAAAEPVVTARRICVDTGAYYSGRLTAVRLDQGAELITVTAIGNP